MPKNRDSRPKQKNPDKVSYLQWERWKREAAGWDYVQDAARVVHVDDNGNVHAACATVTRQQYLEMMLDMESKHPGVGWKEAADELHRFYYDQRLALNGRRL